jgi:hypothetical protein
MVITKKKIKIKNPRSNKPTTKKPYGYSLWVENFILKNYQMIKKMSVLHQVPPNIKDNYPNCIH